MDNRESAGAHFERKAARWVSTEDPVSGYLTIRRIHERDWEAFRELRLESLRTDPLAFGSTIARESAYPTAQWQDWCRRGACHRKEATFVAVDASGHLVGMVGAFNSENAPHVWGMWVRPDWRRRDVAKRLVITLLDWIDQLASPRPAVLDVNPSQEGAVRLYSSLGFTFTGVEHPLRHGTSAITREMVRRPPRHH